MKTVFEELRDADWEGISVQVTAYAAVRVKSFSWRTGSRVDIAHLAKDFAAEAIRLVVSGKRKWEPSKVELLPMLKGVVSSLVSHLVESADTQLISRFPVGEDGEELGDALEVRAPACDDHGVLPARPPDPERAVALRRLEFADERLDALLDAVKDEHELIAVIEALMVVGEATPAAIAEHLGLAVSDVNNRLKRLRRARDRLGTSALLQPADRRTGDERKGT